MTSEPLIGHWHPSYTGHCPWIDAPSRPPHDPALLRRKANGTDSK